MSWPRDYPRRLLSAGLLVRSAGGRVLAVETTYKEHWEVVGGIVEDGESLARAGRRESLEEVGVALPVGDLLVLDCCDATERRPEIVSVVFDGGVHEESLIESFTYPDGEIRAAHRLDVETARQRCGPLVGARVAAAVAAFASGRLPGPTLMLTNSAPDVP